MVYPFIYQSNFGGELKVIDLPLPKKRLGEKAQIRILNKRK